MAVRVADGNAGIIRARSWATQSKVARARRARSLNAPVRALPDPAAARALRARRPRSEIAGHLESNGPSRDRIRTHSIDLVGLIFRTYIHDHCRSFGLRPVTTLHILNNYLPKSPNTFSFKDWSLGTALFTQFVPKPVENSCTNTFAAPRANNPLPTTRFSHIIRVGFPNITEIAPSMWFHSVGRYKLLSKSFPFTCPLATVICENPSMMLHAQV